MESKRLEHKLSSIQKVSGRDQEDRVNKKEDRSGLLYCREQERGIQLKPYAYGNKASICSFAFLVTQLQLHR